MTKKQSPISALPISMEQLARLQTAVDDFSSHQLAWLSGYLWGMVNQNTVTSTPVSAPVPQDETITIISASQTGNARRLSEQLREKLLSEKLNVNLVNAGDYKFKQIAQEKILVIVASTQGEGEPAEEAVALYKYLHSKKAPSLNETAYAVFALGDSSYEKFCQAGKDFDTQLAQLGAKPLLARIDADVEYQAIADAWIEELSQLLKARVPTQSTHQLVAAQVGSVDEIHSSPYTKTSPLTASLSVNQKITGRGSLKDVRHIEIDLGDSGLRYQPGDALGVWFDNDPALVEELIGLLWLTGDEKVQVAEQSYTLRDALTHHLELTQNSPLIVEKYANLSKDETLLGLISDKQALLHYAQNTPIVDMVRQAAAQPTAQEFVELLRPLTPRLYSIASSQAETEDEVHITVGVVRYDIDGRARTGGASGFLADRLKEGDELSIFIEHNDNFRLPADSTKPVIMIGPGTGIAPFRAFMQQRDNEEATGKNWLFFGNPHFVEDFLYQVEWQRYVKEGLLTNISLAWSREQAQKVYVQDKLREQGEEVWHWIEEGAHIYVCGDANHMARDVEQALLEIISQYGNMDSESADEFLSELRVERRYQRDVY
ncbi:TPA: NADPH-dependent assimilatory sulfite reductase flavoprotein subunit [Providencia stuartii]|uniref:NADPH-dependent assimilatory sulfite reductase flavoprotein subunit n=1 Tax=Providencia stuartii TaxID=588 RepID=UPI0018C593FD|nr:NADPH-dependent assimilatory sulfite reductase flavoprotein subunit [Providencia stuartii]MBG5906123.1 NADPH-dependent assimilatory sulfite reductase flavoprotein subunit [Providencia stuartii]MBG5913816.1 NADPH-dependent assimilatory sulfite reductase flavoprotein subunit [Providencia stuartii]MBG5917507.1 NADPH-dependent assimilatory sulfite reductase flavoprotein subunit [Providencia stuartii]MBG5937540.1 NADPH-dependent assimilatory sulfite reductase flavoprotein subunit [Providencia stu